MLALRSVAVLLALVPLACAADTDDSATAGTAAPEILDCLAGVDGLSFAEETSEIDGYRYFELDFQQPVDHDDPAGPQFSQRMRLYHRDETAPLVVATEGYHLRDRQALTEPTDLLHA